jgi:phosphoribosyl-ATP pyrophosphohydrolase
MMATETQQPDLDVLAALEGVLRSRREHAPEGSYSATLLADPEKASRKIMEEAYEFCLELLRPEFDEARTASEAADLVFHVLAGLVGAGVPLRAVLDELGQRRGTAPRTDSGAGA